MGKIQESVTWILPGESSPSGLAVKFVTHDPERTAERLARLADIALINADKDKVTEGAA